MNEMTNQAAQTMPLPCLPWRSIDELEPSDDLCWFIGQWDGKSWTVDGPRTPQAGGCDADEWDYFCYADAPPTVAALSQTAGVAAGVPGDAVAWAVYGFSDEYGSVLLPDYIGTMDVIRNRVMEVARREGYDGHFVQRMAELGWYLEPLFRATNFLETSSKLVVDPGRYFADGPQGHFFADDLQLARDLVSLYDKDDDWTITDLHNPTGAAPAASGGEDDWHCSFCHCASFAHIDERGEDGKFRPGNKRRCLDCKRIHDPAPQPPAAASVSERALELLAAQYKAHSFHRLNAIGDAILAGDLLREGEISCALRALEQALTQQRGDCEAVSDGEVLVVVTGMTGTGKSAVAGEIEILCRALGLEVEHDNAEERGMTHGDWTSALELYKPRVRIVEKNIPRKS